MWKEWEECVMVFFANVLWLLILNSVWLIYMCLHQLKGMLYSDLCQEKNALNSYFESVFCLLVEHTHIPNLNSEYKIN